MSPSECILRLLRGRSLLPVRTEAAAFAPINIALVKYWGKRDAQLNLPVESSLSLTLPEWGTRTRLMRSEAPSLRVNGEQMPWESPLGVRVRRFLELVSLSSVSVETESNIPIGAGLASSSSGFAALTLALNQMCEWELPPESLSCFARLGSGSACRSFWSGFVLWDRGRRKDGLDSHGVPLTVRMPGMRAGIVLVRTEPKSCSSRDAMACTKATSPSYKDWVQMTKLDLFLAQKYLYENDFEGLGRVVERSALSLHWVMQTGIPPVCYTLPETVEVISKVYALRAQGVPVYWTQDAGPNVKLLFLEDAQARVMQAFPGLLTSNPFP